MKLLYITPRFPYPPIKGDQAIIFQRLKHFSKKHEITLLSISDNNIDKKTWRKVSEYCRDIHIITSKRTERYKNLIFYGLFSNIPFQVLYFHSKIFGRKLEKLLSENKYSLIHAFTLRMAPYVSEYAGCPKMLELIDSQELNMRRREAIEKGIKKWVIKEELRRVSVHEKDMAKKFDYAVVVSSIDASTIGGGNIVVNPIGVDIQEFHPKTLKKVHDNLIIFTGNMGYFPNEKAVLYFVKEMFPLIQRKKPNAIFWVVGGGTSHDVKQLEKKNRGVKVLGFVNSMADCISRAVVSVSPMTAGSGIQFKILEALACGVPVVATSLAKGGIELNEDEGLFVADEARVFAGKVVEIMSDTKIRESIGQKAPQAIKDKYSWERSNLILEEIYSELFMKGVHNVEESSDYRDYRARR